MTAYQSGLMQGSKNRVEVIVERIQAIPSAKNVAELAYYPDGSIELCLSDEAKKMLIEIIARKDSEHE